MRPPWRLVVLFSWAYLIDTPVCSCYQTLESRLSLHRHALLSYLSWKLCRYFAFLERCKDAKACTVLLRGGSKDVLNEVERNLADAMQVSCLC